MSVTWFCEKDYYVSSPLAHCGSHILVVCLNHCEMTFWIPIFNSILVLLAFQIYMMAKSVTIVVILLAILYVTNVVVQGRSIDTYNMELFALRSSSCRQICWGLFENCMSGTDSFTSYLFCLEEKDKCLSRCSTVRAQSHTSYRGSGYMK